MLSTSRSTHWKPRGCSSACASNSSTLSRAQTSRAQHPSELRQLSACWYWVASPHKSWPSCTTASSPPLRKWVATEASCGSTRRKHCCRGRSGARGLAVTTTWLVWWTSRSPTEPMRSSEVRSRPSPSWPPRCDGYLAPRLATVATRCRQVHHRSISATLRRRWCPWMFRTNWGAYTPCTFRTLTRNLRTGAKAWRCCMTGRSLEETGAVLQQPRAFTSSAPPRSTHTSCSRDRGTRSATS
mmetsp:Transcript_14452/g.35819  ORF Transcript_14452/g.35819 Transcript_14452/m.35819 type:complete len:241 (-) Transcript_14452:1253-1975(-)